MPPLHDVVCLLSSPELAASRKDSIVEIIDSDHDIGLGKRKRTTARLGVPSSSRQRSSPRGHLVEPSSIIDDHSTPRSLLGASPRHYSDDLPSLSELQAETLVGLHRSRDKAKEIDHALSDTDLDVSASQEQIKKAATVPRLRKTKTDAQKAEALALKEAKRAEKAAAKEAQQSLKAANRLRSNRMDSLPEMLIDVETTLLRSPTGTRLQSALLEAGARNDSIVAIQSNIPKVIQWRRVRTAIYNDVTGMHEPLPKGQYDVQLEPFVLIYWSIEMLVELLATNQLNLKFGEIQSSFGDQRILLLLEGLVIYFRKKENAENRRYAKAVRDGTAAVAEKMPADSITREKAEMALVELQLTRHCLVHYTSTEADSVQSIVDFSIDIGSRPYRLERESFLSFAAIPTRSGLDAQDTYRRMLMEIRLVTTSVSDALVQAHPTLTSLYKAWEDDDPRTLSEIVVGRIQKNGQVASRRIGDAMSKRLYEIFTSRDPDLIIC